MERFVCGKNDESCGDGIFVNEDFIAVVDGVTPKGNKMWDGKKGDEYAKNVMLEKLASIPKDISALDMMNTLSEELRNKSEGLPRAEWLRNTIIVYSKYHKQVWSLGDCQCLINKEYHKSTKKIDKLMGELRSFAIQALIKTGVTEEDIRQNDVAREMILPFLKLQQYLENDNSSEYGYPVLNGETMKQEQIDIYDVKKGDNVILASDGYPRLFPTLAETEAYLQKILKEDPLCYTQNKSTKGVKGNSFDDRAYISFEVEREFEDKDLNSKRKAKRL